MSALSTRRLNLLRLGYAFIGVGIALTRWPSLVLDARSLSVMEGVVLSMLTAMSLLTFLGLRYPVRLLPVLLFEVAWKLIWIAAVAVPRMVSGDLTGRAGEVFVNCCFVVVVLAVIPWRYVWERYVAAPGDPWRARSVASAVSKPRVTAS
jgi:hypothetical protein